MKVNVALNPVYRRTVETVFLEEIHGWHWSYLKHPFTETLLTISSIYLLVFHPREDMSSFIRKFDNIFEPVDVNKTMIINYTMIEHWKD